MDYEKPDEVQDHFLSNKSYDILKPVAQIILPAIGTLYFALAQIWGLPKAEEVVGSIVAFDAFLGAILGVSSASYNNSEAKYDGSIEVEELDEGTKTYSLILNSNPDLIDDKDEVIFKVNSSTPDI